MKNKLYTILICGALLSGGVTSAHADAFAEENFSASVWLTSDYIYRGASFSDEDPAVQASLDWGYGSWYAGVWGTNIELGGFDEGVVSPTEGPESSNDPDSSIEYDIYVGYANSAGPIDYDAMLIYYWFPNDRGSLEVDVLEFWLTLSHTFADAQFSPTVGVFGAYSPDFFYEDGDSIYGKAFLALDLGSGFGLDFAVGVQDVDGDELTGKDGYAYTHWEAGLSTAVKGFGIDLRYHDTNEQRSHVTNFWGHDDAVDNRIVLTISR